MLLIIIYYYKSIKYDFIILQKYDEIQVDSVSYAHSFLYVRIQLTKSKN